MPPAARQTDTQACPLYDGKSPHVGGTIDSGSPDVVIEGLPAARAGEDVSACKAGGPTKIAMGSGTVEINGKLAARVGDITTHGGTIMSGAASVMVGLVGDGVQVLPLDASTSGLTGADVTSATIPKKFDAGPPDADSVSAADEPEPERTRHGNRPPQAVIDVARVVRGNYFEGEPVTLISKSFDPEFGTSPGDGIVSHLWTVDTPKQSLASNVDSVTIRLDGEGLHRVLLRVTDADGAHDEASVVIRVGTVCTQHSEDLDWLERYVDSLIVNAQSALGRTFGMDWAAEMLAHWRSGAGGTVQIAPDRVRGLATVSRETRNVNAMVLKNALPSINALNDGERTTVNSMIQRSFYAYTPSQFFASGGSTLTSRLHLRAHRSRRTVELRGWVLHEWYDRYDWDNGKFTIIPWGSWGRAPYFPQQIPDRWFNLLRQCRGIGKAFDMKSHWYQSLSQRAPSTWPLRVPFASIDLDWVYMGQTPPFA